MALLILGIVLFTLTHLLLSAFPAAIDAQRSRLGEGPVKGVVALLSLGGIILIVVGWKGSVPTAVYAPPLALHSVGLILIAIGIYLFVVANRRSVVKRVLRHPQLTGLVLWCSGHLLLNGDSRSVALFASLGVWAILEILMINRRDGVWERAEAPPLSTDLVTAVIAVVAYLALAALHPWLAGVPVLKPG
jgi:uncharacterized membrane protein